MAHKVKQFGKYKIDKHEETRRLANFLENGNITFSSDLTVNPTGGTLTGVAKFTSGSGLLDSKVSVDSTTGGSGETLGGIIDLTKATSGAGIDGNSAVGYNYTLITDNWFSGSITLPDASAANAGMSITWLHATGSCTGSIGVKSTSNTTLSGSVTVYSTTGDKGMALVIPDGKKGINLDGGAGSGLVRGGGGEGTHYVFHYTGVNNIQVDGTGLLSEAGTVALAAGTTFR